MDPLQSCSESPAPRASPGTHSHTVSDIAGHFLEHYRDVHADSHTLADLTWFGERWLLQVMEDHSPHTQSVAPGLDRQWSSLFTRTGSREVERGRNGDTSPGQRAKRTPVLTSEAVSAVAAVAAASGRVKWRLREAHARQLKQALHLVDQELSVQSSPLHQCWAASCIVGSVILQITPGQCDLF